ncbi:MAG TPA: hypothetical protein PKD00_09840 [Burkholderiales bacterium]|nr:hypothetical protein [Burkholderiales bacterium]
MNNQQAFSAYLDAFKLLHKNDSVLVRDSNFNIAYISELRGKVMGLDNPDEFIGCKVTSLPSISTNKEALDALKIIDDIIVKKQYAEFVVSDPNLCSPVKIFDLYYKQLINPTNNQVVGYSSFMFPLSLDNHMHFVYEMLDIIQEGNLKGQETQAIELTKREREILFLACLRLSSREIAEIITHKANKQISSSTIGNIIRQQLFKKFKVYSLEALISKAIALGYYTSVPNEYCKYKLIVKP